MPHINLLPWRQQQKARKQKQYIAVLGGCALFALFVVYGINAYYSTLIENQQARNQFLQSEISVLDSKIKEIQTLKDIRTSLEQRMQLIVDLQRNRNLGAQIMDELVKVVPPGIYLIKLEKTDDKVVLQGKTESNNRVSTMMRQIESSYLLHDPVLNAIIAANNTDQARVLSDFSMVAEIYTEKKDRERKESK
ncbi:PilN domain-containing protein [Gayadomonas joobiniege]|uniref:PilN domain-containing protein n=1 Tax=Gayadomonas joobiniege TaxID=1234606 RepID=UPI00035CAD49|nr:PilN domain-containing protein [Gayadomonas joobiniege]